MEPSKDVTDLIAQAFKGSQMPRAPRELAPDGIDAHSVIEHYLGRSQAQVESAPFRASLCMEDFSYMTPMAVEYYLPSVLRIMLRLPWDDELWIYLHGYLRPRRDATLWWNLRALNPTQFKAIGKWAGYLRDQWLEDKPARLDACEATELSDAYCRLALRK